MCGEVVEVDSLVGAAGCEDYFLGLFGDWSGWLGDGEAADSRLMGVKKEGICELGFAIGRYCCCDAMEDSIVGSRDNLDCGGLLGGCWCGRLDFFARSCC